MRHGRLKDCDKQMNRDCVWFLPSNSLPALQQEADLWQSAVKDRKSVV